MLIEDSRDAAALIEASRARCLDDLDALLEKGGDEAVPQLVGYVKEKGLLPEERPAPAPRKPAARSGIRPVGSRRQDDAGRHARQDIQDKRKEGSEGR